MRLRWMIVSLLILSGLIVLPLLVYSKSMTQEAIRSAPVLATPDLSHYGTNLLFNGDFELGFSPRGGDRAVTVANGWEPWFVPGTGFPMDRPEWSMENIWTHRSIRVFHGDYAQKFFGQGKTHIAGIYQQVPIPRGSRVRFSIWTQVWSSHCDNPCVSPLELCNAEGSHGNYQVAVGIDPTGGTDPLAATVRWNNQRMPWDVPYDTWVNLAIEEVAQAGVITVFVRGQAEFPVKHNDSYWDAAHLELVQGPNKGNFLPFISRNFEGVTPVATGTVPVTLTPAPTLSPTPSFTLTPTATATATSTPAPSATPTMTPPPQMCQEGITNGDFEADSGWIIAATDHPAGYSTTHAAGNTGRSMRLGIENSSDNTQSLSYITQAVAIPPNATDVTLRFKYYPVSQDLQGDHFEAILWDRQGRPLTFLLPPQRTNAQTWVEHSVSLARYAGQTVQIYFNVYNDGANGVTAVYLDDVSLEVCGPAGQLMVQPMEAVQPLLLGEGPPYPFPVVAPTWVRYSAQQLEFLEPETCDDLRIEFVQFESFGTPVDVAGWTLEDAQGNVFTFPHLRLEFGDRVRVWSRSGPPVPTDLYWNSPVPLLDDDGDRLTLRDANGAFLAEICYSIPDQPIPGPCP